MGDYLKKKKKTNNKYYNNKNLISTGMYPEIGLTKKTKPINKSEENNNQKIVKDYLQNLGLRKEIVAGIMGNIQKESSFNPNAINEKDLNNYPSVGLIQWNLKFYSNAKSVIGDTVKTQISKVTDGYTNNYQKFIELCNQTNNLTSYHAAYLFASKVEICDKCNKTFDTYKSSYQAVRSEYANDFYKRFNDPKDTLYWG